MTVREVHVRVVSNGTAQWDDFKKGFFDLFKINPEDMARKEAILSPGKTSTEVVIATTRQIDDIRKALTATGIETIMVFCPLEAIAEPPTKRGRRRKRGRQRGSNG